jgi:predicted ATPase/DNA-binding SARP family transcriptional activator
MRFGILGPLEVADEGGRGLVLGGRRQRSVLAILLLHANEVVSRDRLVEELWSGQPPASAATSLHAHVSRLRRALGEERRIVTAGGGYLIRVADGELDRDRFERLVQEGAGAISRGAWELASGRLREALSLWRGPPLSDFRYDSFAQAEIARLEELHVGAVERRIEAELALGRDAQVVGDLERLVREHPYRERLRGQLMLALYRTGRQADALTAYREASQLLRDELGLEPSESLQGLERSILRHDPTLHPVARAASVPAGNLPVPATPFLGRARELAEIIALLRTAGTRLLTLTGVGGSGKTRLALQAAQACAADHGDGAWFVGLADVGDPELIAPTICEALEVAEQPGLTAAQCLKSWLGDHKRLLVLDNLEQLATGAEVLGELLASCPGLALLTTSREPLHLAGEQQYEVPVLEREDAIELFISRVRAVTPLLSIEVELAREICERLDRLPLAIELAGARTKILSPAEILARLERVLPVLGGGPRDAPQRQRTLRATIDWSYDLLTADEKWLFARLAVFAGGCTFAAAEAVCEAQLDTLQALVDRSLVRVEDGRYLMLQTLREYALERVNESGEANELRRLHAQWFVDLLEADGLHPYASPGTTIRLSPERQNFRGALEWAAQAGDAEILARLAAPLTWYWWEKQGQLNEAERWLRIARDHIDQYPLPLQAKVLSAARSLALTRGEIDEGAALCEQALAIYRQVRDPENICREILSRGLFAAERGDFARCRAALEEAVAIARKHDVTGFLPTALMNLGNVEIEEGRLEEARTHSEEALALAEGLAGPIYAIALINLAHVANLQRRHHDGAHLGRKAATAALSREDLLTAAAAAMEVAWALAAQGQTDRAGPLLGAAVEFSTQSGVARQRTDVVCEHAAHSALRDHLDEQTAQALFQQGRDRSLEEAIQDELERDRYSITLRMAPRGSIVDSHAGS